MKFAHFMLITLSHTTLQHGFLRSLPKYHHCDTWNLPILKHCADSQSSYPQPGFCFLKQQSSHFAGVGGFSCWLLPLAAEESWKNPCSSHGVAAVVHGYQWKKFIGAVMAFSWARLCSWKERANKHRISRDVTKRIWAQKFFQLF